FAKTDSIEDDGIAWLGEFADDARDGIRRAGEGDDVIRVDAEYSRGILLAVDGERSGWSEKSAGERGVFNHGECIGDFAVVGNDDAGVARNRAIGRRLDVELVALRAMDENPHVGGLAVDGDGDAVERGRSLGAPGCEVG